MKTTSNHISKTSLSEAPAAESIRGIFFQIIPVQWSKAEIYGLEIRQAKIASPHLNRWESPASGGGMVSLESSATFENGQASQTQGEDGLSIFWRGAAKFTSGK
jgi:hypothetical protein